MTVSNFYTAAEAIERLEGAGLSESTFYRWVREGIISKELPKGRQRGALYPRADVEKAIAREGHGQLSGAQAPSVQQSEGVTEWITAADLPYVLALDYEMYGPDGYVDMSITRAWWEKNPYMCRILYDGTDRRYIWGALTIIPLKEDIILRLLRGEMKEKDITPANILTYERGQHYYGYIASATVRPEHRQHLRKLIRSMLEFLCEQYPDVQLTKLYAYAASEEGLGLIKHLFFSPCYDLGDNCFELDPFRYNPSPLVQGFQQCIQAKQ